VEQMLAAVPVFSLSVIRRDNSPDSYWPNQFVSSPTNKINFLSLFVFVSCLWIPANLTEAFQNAIPVTGRGGL
jgi:hypothetical protein